MMAEISCGAYSRSPSRTLTSSPIFRLMERTVRSGARIHWFRAGVPTSNRPSGSKPTTEGRMASPSVRITSGRPSRITAISLLVVPKSMPTIGSIDQFMLLRLSMGPDLLLRAARTSAKRTTLSFQR